MFLDTGLRLAELANLQLSDINMERGIIKVLGKGNKERLVRIGLKTHIAVSAFGSVKDGTELVSRSADVVDRLCFVYLFGGSTATSQYNQILIIIRTAHYGLFKYGRI